MPRAFLDCDWSRRGIKLVPLLSGVKPHPMVGSGRYAEPIPVKSPVMWKVFYATPSSCANCRVAYKCQIDIALVISYCSETGKNGLQFANEIFHFRARNDIYFHIIYH